MTHYWITLSNYWKSAKVRESEQWWWYLHGRDKPNPNDKVVIYQPGSTKVAKRDSEEIKEKHKCKFIGSFTVDERIPKENYLNIVEDSILWDESEFVDIYFIRDDLECTSEVIEKHSNMGLLFLNKTWIPISRHDYDLILSKKGK